MTADQEWREQLRERARQGMRREIERCRAAGIPLFTDEQIQVLHQQIRDKRNRRAA